MQPSLWAHVVLTLEGLSVVAGWKGAKGKNRIVMDSVNWFYGFGLGREEMELVKWWKSWGK